MDYLNFDLAIKFVKAYEEEGGGGIESVVSAGTQTGDSLL